MDVGLHGWRDEAPGSAENTAEQKGSESRKCRALWDREPAHCFHCFIAAEKEIRMKLSVAVLALAAAANVGAEPATVADFGSLDVEALAQQLSSWNLGSVFGPHFAATDMDGESLLLASKKQLTEAFPDISNLHWSRLFRKMQPFWDAQPEEASVDPSGNAGPARQRRQLGAQSVSNFSVQGYSGVSITPEKSAVMLHDDVVLARTASGLTIAAAEVNITGDLRVNGKITSDSFGDLSGVVAELTRNVSLLQSGFTYCEDCYQTSVEDFVMVETFNNETESTTLVVDPSKTGGCPGDLVLATDSTFNYGRGLDVCYRNMTSAGYQAFYYEVSHDIGSIDIDLVYHQHYSADAFYSGSSTTVESDVFCEGVTFASIDALGKRTHIYTAAAGYSRDASYTSYNCPPRNCNYDDDTYCVGPKAPLWMGDAYSCNSGSSGEASQEWFGAMEAQYSAAVRLQAGDLIEVRVMADQATSNEDVGIAKLTMVLGDTPAYPYDDGSGWVHFAEELDNRTLVGIDPSVGGNCPGDMSIVYGHDDRATCARSLTAAGSVSATYDVGHDVGAVTVDVQYNQYYSADAFASAAGSVIDDEYFVEGITIASIDSADTRSHLFTAVVGLTYDSAQTSYNCPLLNCAYDDKDYCVGPLSLPWMGTNFYCDSLNSGDWEEVWYAPMGPEDPVTVGATIAEGESVEVRIMADQASSNEDAGITSLKLTLDQKQAYPYDLGTGWVVFEEPSDGKIVVGIDPSVGGRCPGGLSLINGYQGLPTCTRTLTAAGAVSASYSAPFDVGTVKVDVEYSQYYSADAFASASGTDIDDSYFMEGITIASIDSADQRTHIFSAAVGLSYDTAQTSYNCPLLNCDFDDASYCVGPLAPAWLGTNFYCNSMNSGDWEETWYAPMGPANPITVGTQISEGDDIEVRIMADQASSNEDAGITSLKLTLETKQTYPYDDGTGWVVFAEPTNGTVVVGIDPRVGGKCPGGLSLVNGYQGSPTCTRSQTAAGSVAATYSVPFDVGTVVVEALYNQYYSADAFSGDADSTIDDSYFMEGISIASIDSSDARTHIWSAAVGINYDEAQSSYNCPYLNCDYVDKSNCVGPYAHPWMGLNFYCDSKNSGDWEEAWYSPMGPENGVTVPATMSLGDDLEVRLMADQASSNEDVGITSLKMTLKTKQLYPVDPGAGWVLFEESTATRTSIGIDPTVGGQCPGALDLQNGSVNALINYGDVIVLRNSLFMPTGVIVGTAVRQFAHAP